MLTIEQINAIRVLIARATLKGDEVPTFNDVVAALATEELQARATVASGSAQPGGDG